MQQLDESSKRDLSVQADMELNRRSRAGSLIHFALLLIVVFFSSYFREHPVTIVAVGTILLGLGIGRLFLSSLFAKRYAEDPIFWKQLFCVVAWTAALTWGGFCCLTMGLYGQQWISWLVLLITTGIAAGSSSAFSPDIAVGGIYMAFLLLPTAGWELFKGGASNYSVAAVVCIYGGYLWMQPESSRKPTGTN